MAHRNQAQSRVSAFYGVADVVGSRLRKRGRARDVTVVASECSGIRT